MNPPNLNPLCGRNRKRTAVLVAAVSLAFAAGLVLAAPSSPANRVASDFQSLENGAVEDVTPQQKYRSAIREAGGAYKESLRECAQAAYRDRLECVRNARATYDRDMAEAKQLWPTQGAAITRPANAARHP